MIENNSQASQNKHENTLVEIIDTTKTATKPVKNEPPSDDIAKSSIRTRLFIVVVMLILFAVLAISYRMWLQQSGQFPAGDKVWSVSLITHISVPEPGALVRISPPWDTPYSRLYGQKIHHPGMRLKRTNNDSNSRNAVLVATHSGKTQIEMNYDLHVSQKVRKNAKRAKLSEMNRSRWLATEAGIPVESPLARSIIDALKTDNPETTELVNRIFEYISEKVVIRTGNDDAEMVFKNHQGSVLGVNRTLLTLFRAAHLPARMITGINLTLKSDKQPVYWVEVYFNKNWHSYDVINGHINELPAHFIPMHKGSEFFLEIVNADIIDSYWTIELAEAPKGLLVSTEPSIIHIFDLTRLAPDIREVLAILLLLPLGALATEIIRQFIGMRTYGTFTPTLLALAAIFVDWFTALITFSLVILIGIAGRAMLPKLELPRVPTLCIVFTMVATVMAIVVSSINYFSPSMDSGIILLPIVILTTLVDRIYAISDERGLRVAMTRLGWTVLSALVSLIILMQSQWGEWILIYPEIHAITIAVIIFLGSYKGKQLSSYKWLRWLKEPVKKKTVVPNTQ